MRQTKTCIASLILFLFVSVQSFSQEKYSKVAVPAPNAQVYRQILDLLELDHFSFENNQITAVINEHELSRLKKSGLPFKVVVDDMIQHTLKINSEAKPEDVQQRSAFQEACKTVGSIITTPASFGNGGTLRLGASAANPGYFTYADMAAKMLDLQNAYPGIVTRFSIGNSYGGNAIYAVKISDNVGTDEAEPEVLYTGLQHAREAIGGTSLIFFMQYLAENYAGNSKIAELVNNREIYIIPCVNPDGYIYNYSTASTANGGGLWRKNRRPMSGGNLGVDLNRNYGIDWGNCAGASTSCGSSSSSAETYFGPSVFSEPETQAVRAFVQGRNFIAAIDQHCYGPYYSLPYGRPSLHPALNTQDAAFYTHVPALMGMYNGHRAGNSPETVNYEVAGGIKDWLLMGDIGTGTKGKIYGMTGEAGGGDFWAPVSQIPQLCKELCYQNLQLAFAAGAYYDIQDASDVAMPAGLTGNFSFNLRRIGLTSGNAVVSIVPMQNISSVDPPVTVSTLSNFYDTHSGTIGYTLPSSMTAGQRIKFAWKVESGGITIYDTVVKLYDPTIVMSDNMEGTLTDDWTVSGGFGYSTSSAYQGSNSLSESPVGNYGNSATATATYKNSFSLVGTTAAYLSFWVRHRAENFRDKLQVQVSINSTDGVNGTWTPICGRNTLQETNTTSGGSLGGQPALTGIRDFWTKELFDLSSYLGQANVRFRFRFTSDAAGATFDYAIDDGFYIDNVQLARTNAALLILPAEFLSFNAKLVQNNTVQLDWDAVVDEQHEYFEVEKSSDGASFQSIGKVTHGPLRFFDHNASAGSNYYRIKQVDKTGEKTYSKTIHIVIKNNFVISLYPNPVKDEALTIRIDSKEKQVVKLQVVDMTGRVVFDQTKRIEPPLNEMKIETGSWKPQTYILRVMDQNGNNLVNQKIVKQ